MLNKKLYLEVEHETLKENIELFEKALPIIEKFIGKVSNKRLETALKNEGIELSLTTKEYDWINESKLTSYHRVVKSEKMKGYCGFIYPNFYYPCYVKISLSDDNRILDVEKTKLDIERYKKELERVELSMKEEHQQQLKEKYLELKRINNEFVEMLQGLDRYANDKYKNITTIY